MNVTRRRRRPTDSRTRRGPLGGRGLRLVIAGGAALALTTGGVAVASTTGFGNHTVGSTYPDGSLQVSDNQTINPVGDRLMTPFGKIMGSTISPNGKLVAATSTDRSVDLQVFDMGSYQPVAAAGTETPAAANSAAIAAGFATDSSTSSIAYINTPMGQTSAGTCTPGGTSADGTVGQGNPTFSPDGSKLYVPVSCGFDVYSVDANGTLSSPTTLFLPTTTAAHPIVSGTANPFSTTTTELPLTAGSTFGPDGNLYAALNGQDAVDEIDPSSGNVVNQWKVGVAPRQLAFSPDGKLYVTDEGGRTPTAGDTTMQSYGSEVVADGTTGSSTTGTVSVIDPSNTPSVASTIGVGLHPTAIYADGSTLYVANTNDDTVSVIDTTSGKVVQTISTQPWTGSKVGYQPDSIDVVDHHLLVSLGRANAIEVFGLGSSAQDPVSEIGLLPTDYYPSGVFTDSTGKIVVANRRGIDARAPFVTSSQGENTTTVSGHGTHSTTASLTRFAWPTDATIKADTSKVFQENGWSADPAMTAKQKVKTCKTVTRKVKLTGAALKQAKAHHKKTYKIVKKKVCTTKTVTVPSSNPVPTRIGTRSSKIKHVFLIVKENRTYDQVFGDMKQGNGDPSLAQFGQQVTPNQHALASQFGLFDNTYDVGTNSSEGHDWMMMGDNPEYNESSAGEYTRSYDTEEDVLGHQRSGFLWGAVEAAGATAKNYGEFEYGEGKPGKATVANSPSWQQYYCAATAYDASGDTSQLTSGPLAGASYGSVIPSLNAISDPLSPSFDTSIPDIYREAIWQQDFDGQVKSAKGADAGVPNFNMLWFSSDHTSGQAAPEAQVADNDLAVGKVVDKISHSPIWKDSVIFVAEDDSQAGVDHVDGHRAPVQVISPWAQHGKVVDTYYSQINMVRTIEQILGATPLNEKVAAATPMYDAFTSKPNDAPYDAVANQVPLTEGLVGGTPACGNDNLGQSGAAAKRVQARAKAAVAVPSAEQTVADEWATWAAKQHLTGGTAIADFANPELMNRYTWYRTSDWSKPYPGDKRILAPSQVPGAYVPNHDSN
ncbi:MAG: phosphoesterase [Nocardioidaceae bacterium]|nr:phosphoesterase [Nocardioidaceae bacterium]MCL2612468.1 phosphoesterase [Nocardioidaceae bacterium]